jgi:hypothetical protein
MNGPLVALILQPEDDSGTLPPSPVSDGDIIVFAIFVLIIAAVLGFDMIRTWWATNEWRRRPRRRRRPAR